MEERKCYLYMMTERQTRINQNNQRIDMLQFTLDHDDSYQKYKSLIQKLKRILEQRHQKEIMKEKEYQQYRDKEVITQYSNEIQAIVEDMGDRKEQMEILQMILDQFQQKGKMNLFQLVYQYCKKVNDKNKEELSDETCWIPTIKKFYHIYKIIINRKKQNLREILGMKEWGDSKFAPLLMSVPFISNSTPEEVQKVLELDEWKNPQLQHLLKDAVSLVWEYDARKISKTSNINYLEFHSLMKQYQKEVNILEKNQTIKETELEEIRRTLRVYLKQKHEFKKVSNELQKWLSYAEKQFKLIEAQRKPIEDEITRLTNINQQYIGQYQKLKESYMSTFIDKSENAEVISLQKYKKTS